jgi:hypothetical protein
MGTTGGAERHRPAGTRAVPKGSLMSDANLPRLTDDELAAEGGSLLPDKEVLSLLDLNVDLDLGLDLAAPIDLAVAANANIAAPIDAAVSANVLSFGSEAQALADQGTSIEQGLNGEAIANAPQTSSIEQGEVAPDPAPTDPAEAPIGSEIDNALSGGLLNLDVNLALDADIAAPIAGAVAANANVAAPIDAAVAANVGSIDSSATAVAEQDAIIVQNLDGVAEATADQDSEITQ